MSTTLTPTTGPTTGPVPADQVTPEVPDLGTVTVRPVAFGPSLSAFLVTSTAGPEAVFGRVSEMALALHHSGVALADLSGLNADRDHHQVAALILTGALRVGTERLRALAGADWDITRRHVVTEQISTDEARRRHDQIWGDRDRQGRCRGLADLTAFHAQIRHTGRCYDRP